MKSEKLPAVLLASEGSLSMERALNQILDLLDHAVLPENKEDFLLASMDDVRTMLRAVER